MIREIHGKTYGKGKYAVNLEIFDTQGSGLVVFASGGEFPHLGGVALASPGIELHGGILSSCDLWTMTVPGHKDAELARNIAKKLCKATGESVSVSVGIHTDHATNEEIKVLCDNAMMAADLFLEEYLKTGRVLKKELV